jgi:hypothetical protein
MSAFIESKLSKLPIGATIKLTYDDGESRKTTQGTVVDSDFKTGLELRTVDGKPLLVMYSVVLIFQEIAASPTTPVKTTPVIPTDQDVPPVPPQESAEIDEVGKLSVSDNQLKAIFDELPKEDRKKLNGAYESFKYGVKVSDRSKQLQAASSARQILFREDNAGYVWHKNSARFCGDLLVRVQVLNPEVFLVGECFWEAACCSYRLKKYQDASVYAALSLLEEGTEHASELLTILIESAQPQEDASAILMVQEKLPDLFSDPAVEKRLFEANGIALTTGAEVRWKLLKALYPNTDIAETIRKDWKSSTPSAKKSVPVLPESKALESVPQIRQIGSIFRVQWTNQTGTIQYGEGQQCSFAYADIEDTKLRSEIDACLSTDLGGKTYWVEFALEDEKAVHIKGTESPIEQARRVMENWQYKAAVSLCKLAAGTAEWPQAVNVLIQYAVDWYQAEHLPEALDEAEHAYQENQAQISWSAKTLSSLAKLYRYKLNFQKALEFSEQAISIDSLPAKLRATLLAQYVRFCMEGYEETQNEELLRMIKPKADAWLHLYQAAGLSSDSQSKKLYSTILQRRILSLCARDLLDEAEADYEELCRIDPLSSTQASVQTRLAETRKRLKP